MVTVSDLVYAMVKVVIFVYKIQCYFHDLKSLNHLCSTLEIISFSLESNDQSVISGYAIISLQRCCPPEVLLI